MRCANCDNPASYSLPLRIRTKYTLAVDGEIYLCNDCFNIELKNINENNLARITYDFTSKKEKKGFRWWLSRL